MTKRAKKSSSRRLSGVEASPDSVRFRVLEDELKSDLVDFSRVLRDPSQDCSRFLDVYRVVSEKVGRLEEVHASGGEMRAARSMVKPIQREIAARCLVKR